MTPYQFPVTSSKKKTHTWCQTWSFRVATNVLQSHGDVAESSPSPSMVVTKPFWKDGTRMTITASLCQILGGLRSRLFSMTNLHWTTNPTLQQQRKRTRNEKTWAISLSKEGVQGPLNQRPDFVEAKREIKRLHDEHVKETSEVNKPINPIQRSRQRRNQQFEGLEEYDYQVDPRTGWRSFPSKSQGNLRHPTFSSSSIHREQQDDWKSNKSWNSWRSSSWTEQ